MRSIITGYLNNTISRRGFIKNMLASGFTVASTSSVMKSLEGLKEENSFSKAEYRTVIGSGGDLLVQQIKEAGIKYVFTNTGSFEVGFFDALINEPGLQLILGLHEGIVISMADGYHRITKEPAFVNVHVIAGTAQMAGQLFNAHKDGSSLIVSAGLLDNEVFSDDIILGPSPGFDQKEINRQFTKISWEVKNPKSIPAFTRRAFKVAMTQPGGPVYIAYTNYAMEAQNMRGKVVPKTNFMIPSDVKGAPELIEKTAKLLIEAKNPVIIYGDEVWKSGAQDKAVEMAELLTLPVASSREAFRNFPAQHPLYVGRYSPGRTMLGKNVDLVISFGTKDFGDRSVTPVTNQTRFIKCGINTSHIGRNYPFDLAVVGNVKEILSDLIDYINGSLTKGRISSIKSSRLSEIKAFTENTKARSLEHAKLNFKKSPIHPDRLGYEMSRALDNNAIIVSENFGGSYQFFNFGLKEDETMWMFNTGYSLGWGVGAAIGAKLGRPDRQVVSSIGDGSVMYSASGFWTQARYGIPVLTIVWNNKNYQTVRRSFARYKGKMTETGQYAGVYLGDPDIDFVKLAESQGVEGEKVTSPGDIESALKRGIQKTKDGRPYLIDVLVARIGPGSESTWHQKFNLAEK
ncbi:MAG: thiamine pyrophosphate-binding protein [Candidatus Aminicenantes bacterium]|nr:MAG: thiamine pyrophosphate-binding protein [Candidatus Aminicenantes bacterium]